MSRRQRPGRYSIGHALLIVGVDGAVFPFGGGGGHGGGVDVVGAGIEGEEWRLTIAGVAEVRAQTCSFCDLAGGGHEEIGGGLRGEKIIPIGLMTKLHSLKY